MRLIGVFDAGHGADHWQAVRCVRDRAVDVAPHPCGAKDRYTLHRVLDVPFEAFKVVWIQLEAEVVRHWIVFRDPVCLAVPLIRAEVQAVFVLTQVVGAVHIADHRGLFAVFLRPCFDFVDFLGQEILVRHHDHGNVATPIWFEPFADAGGIVARSVYDFLAGDVALVGVHDPLARVVLGDACRGAEAFNLGAQIAGPFSERLGQLSGVDVTVKRVPKDTLQIMCFDERVIVFHVFDADHFERETHRLRLTTDTFEFLTALFGVTEA